MGLFTDIFDNTIRKPFEWADDFIENEKELEERIRRKEREKREGKRALKENIKRKEREEREQAFLRKVHESDEACYRAIEERKKYLVKNM